MEVFDFRNRVNDEPVTISVERCSISPNGDQPNYSFILKLVSFLL